jgi:hypothetical protein
MTRRYRSSCRVNRWRSDADGVRLLGLSKSEATLDLSAMLQLQLRGKRVPPRLLDRDCLGRTPDAQADASFHARIFALTLRPARRRQFITQRHIQHRQDALQQTHLRTFWRHAADCNFDILTFFAAPQATVSRHCNFAQTHTTHLHYESPRKPPIFDRSIILRKSQTPTLLLE